MSGSQQMSRLPRWLHRWWAKLGGYFWLPCPVCGRSSGGHEWRAWGGRPSVIPDPDQPNVWIGICPSCTRAGYGYEDWPLTGGSGIQHV